jgi:hypothetical protein
MSSIFSNDITSANVVLSVFNEVSTHLSRARDYFKTFAENVERYRRGISCKDFAEVYDANRGFFRGGVAELSRIVEKSDELYEVLYNSAFDSSVERGRELAYLFQNCVLSGAISRLYGMATYLQWVFDKTIECCLGKSQAKERLFSWEEGEGTKEEESFMSALTRGTEYGWDDVLVVFPIEDINKYSDFCEYFSKHATVDNLAILFRGFSRYFVLVNSFINSLIEGVEQYKAGLVGRSAVMEPLRVCRVKEVQIRIAKRRGETGGAA